MSAEPRVVIVGAGPAGANAALALAAAGVRSIVIDDNPRAGGQIFRVGPNDAIGPVKPDPRGVRLRARLAERADMIEHRAGHEVIGATPERRLTVAPPDGPVVSLDADALVIATGAVEVSVPVPGWTLPGVFGLGGLQILLKQSALVPDRPVVLGGTGPLLYLVAAQMVKTGARLAAVVDAADWPSPRHLLGLAAMPKLLRQGIGHLLALKRAGVPIHRRAAIAAIDGADGVAAVRIARLRPDWSAESAPDATIACGIVGVGFGVRPNVELTGLIGCAHLYDPATGGWVVRRDEDLATSIPGVYAIGDGAAIGGVENALAEGTIVAASILRRLGRPTPAGLVDRATGARRRKTRRTRFRAAINGWSGLRDGIFTLAAFDTIVCRCEGVTRAAIESAAASGFDELRAAKLHSRAGMGLCQGRVCGDAAARIVAHAAGVAVEAAGMPRARLPLRPVAFSNVAAPKS
ncbi:MAG: NAD(P)/FAD-dependent oxidoreductase [Alphaproteobacteria bacterium]|nr:NAD(P)/FAD-dependent oxidoreductase [Alphaproteobacteria bacterium]